MVTGQLPFTGTSPVDLLMKHVDARPPRPSEYVADLPAGLDAFILQMLTKDPETRPGSADALRQQLQRLRRTLVRPARTAQQRSAAPPALAPTPAPKPPEPAPPPPVPDEERTDISRPAPQGPTSAAADEPTTQEVTVVPVKRPLSRRLALPVGIGAAVLLAAGGAAIVYRTEPAPAPKAPTPFVVAPTPATPEPATEPAIEPLTPTPAQPETPAVAQPGTTEPATNVAQPTHGTQPTTPPANPLEAPGRKEGDTVAAVTPTEPSNPEPVVVKPRHREGSEAGIPQHVLLSRIQTLERDLEARVAAGDKVSVNAGRSTLDKLRQKVRDSRDAKTRRELAEQLTGWERMFLKR
jgi:serine/threonine-protein kinase